MVDMMATVTSRPTFFMGTHTHAEHEEFWAQTASGPIEVIDNVDLAPPVPVGPGDRIEVCGEMVRDPGKARRSFIGRTTIPRIVIPTASFGSTDAHMHSRFE